MTKISKWSILFVIAVLSINFFGCAAILNDDPELVYISSDSDADIYVDGNKVGTGDAEVLLSTKDSYTLKAKKGSKENSIKLNSKTGIGWIILDICCGLIPLVIDIATDSWNEFEGDGDERIPLSE